VRKFVSCDLAVLQHETVTRLSHTNDVVWGPNIGKVRTVDKVSQVACVGWRVRAGAFVEGNTGTADNVADGPQGDCSK
jgi:hypothetical protein